MIITELVSLELDDFVRFFFVCFCLISECMLIFSKDHFFEFVDDIHGLPECYNVNLLCSFIILFVTMLTF